MPDEGDQETMCEGVDRASELLMRLQTLHVQTDMDARKSLREVQQRMFLQVSVQVICICHPHTKILFVSILHWTHNTWIHNTCVHVHAICMSYTDMLLPAYLILIIPTVCVYVRMHVCMYFIDMSLPAYLILLMPADTHKLHVVLMPTDTHTLHVLLMPADTHTLHVLHTPNKMHKHTHTGQTSSRRSTRLAPAYGRRKGKPIVWSKRDSTQTAFFLYMQASVELFLHMPMCGTCLFYVCSCVEYAGLFTHAHV